MLKPKVFDSGIFTLMCAAYLNLTKSVFELDRSNLTKILLDDD